MKKLFGAFTFCLQLVKCLTVRVFILFLKYKMSYPSEKRLKEWKIDFNWLKFTEDNKMKCKVCCWRADSGVISTSKFVLCSSNYQLSTIKDHDKCGPHLDAIKAEVCTLPPRKVVQHAPTDSAIAKPLQKKGQNDRDTVNKLHEIAFYIASEGLPFTAIEKQVELEALHGVKYSSLPFK